MSSEELAKLAQGRIDSIVFYYTDGCDLEIIAEMFGVTPSTIRYFLRREGYLS